MKIQADKAVLWSCVLLSPVSVPLGSFSVGLHIFVILFAASFVMLERKSLRLCNFFRILLFTLALTFYSALTGYFSPCKDLAQKSFASFALFGVMLFCLIQLAGRVNSISLHKSILSLVVFIVAAVAIEQLWLWTTGASKLIRPSGIYLEPSHLALSSIPLIVALTFSHKVTDKRWAWSSLLILLTLSGSATLFILVFLCFFASYFAINQKSVSSIQVIRIFAVVISFSVLIFFSPYWGDFYDRFRGVLDTDITANISSIVYVNGWQTSFENFKSTNGLGLGFNRMGCIPRPTTEASEVLEVMGLGAANFNDGSFTFSKIISELGIFGLVTWAGAICLLFRMVTKRDRMFSYSPIYIALSVSASLVLVIGGLIRGTSYFSGPFVLGLYFILTYIVKPPNNLTLQKLSDQRI